MNSVGNLKSNISDGIKIFIDFDDVVFNTKKFKNDLAKIFRKHGVESEEQIKFLKENKKLNNRDIAKDVGIFLKNLERYIFPDTYIFFKSFPKKSLFLLSYGNQIFQKTKIRGSHIGSYFGRVIINKENKIKSILRIARKNFECNKIILIDDRPENLEKIEQKIITFRMRRSEGRYSDLNYDEIDYEVKNLKEALATINKLKN